MRHFKFAFKVLQLILKSVENIMFYGRSFIYEYNVHLIML